MIKRFEYTLLRFFQLPNCCSLFRGVSSMAACASISIAVPVVRTAPVRGLSCSRQQRVGIAAAFPSLSCTSGDYCIKEQWQKQCVPKKTSRIKASQEGIKGPDSSFSCHGIACNSVLPSLLQLLCGASLLSFWNGISFG